LTFMLIRRRDMVSEASRRQAQEVALASLVE
jgi:hypothetical protein